MLLEQLNWNKLKVKRLQVLPLSISLFSVKYGSHPFVLLLLLVIFLFLLLLLFY